MGVLPILGRGLHFFAERFTHGGELERGPAENWIIADFLSTRIDLKMSWRAPRRVTRAWFLSARRPGRMAREERVRMCSRKWLIVALVACGLASACSDYNTNLSIQTSSSILTFVSPSTATAGGQGFTITANGSGFVSGALDPVEWNRPHHHACQRQSADGAGSRFGPRHCGNRAGGRADSRLGAVRRRKTSTTRRPQKFRTLSSSRSAGAGHAADNHFAVGVHDFGSSPHRIAALRALR